MTQEEKFAALAKYLNWEPDPTTDLWYCIDGKTAGFRKETGVVEIMPRWFDDLNAMHEAEKVLGSTQCAAYRDSLEQNSASFEGMDGSCIDWQLVHATAEQRAEALGETLGLWE